MVSKFSSLSTHVCAVAPRKIEQRQSVASILFISGENKLIIGNE